MGAGRSGNFETEARAEIGGEGSEANEPFADITSGLRISGAETDCTEGQPNKLLEDFCFTGELKDVAVGVPGSEMGCGLLRGGGCCGVALGSEETELPPGRTPYAEGLNSSTIVAWRARGGCLVDPFKDGADWLVVKLVGGRLEEGIDESGDVLIGGRIGRVGVEDVEDAGDNEEGPKIFTFLACSGVVDGATLNSFPGEKAGALGLRTVVGSWSCFCSETVTVDVGRSGPALGSMFGAFILGNPDGALCEAEKAEDEGASNAAAGVGDADGSAGLENGDPKVDVAVPWFPMFATTGAEVDTPKGEREELASPGFCTADGSPPIVPEAVGAKEVEPKVEGGVPKAEEVLLNAEPGPKPRFPKTFGVVLRFANAEAVGGTELAVEGTGGPDTGLECPKAEAGGVPKAEVEEPVPTITEGEGRTPKLSVSHAVALGFNGWGWCWGPEGSSGSIGSSSRKKASSSSQFGSASMAITPSSETTPSMTPAMEMPSRIASMSSIVSLPKRRSRMQATR